jgi:hypothetical protein
MAFVVVGRNGPSSSATRLGTVERLDLRFLINWRHQRVLWRIDMEADGML